LANNLWKWGKMRGMKFISPAFDQGAVLPQRYTCDGAGISPPFRWDLVEPGTFDFTLICEDPDAPKGTFTHWLLYNIPWGTRRLEEGLPNHGVLSMGANQGTNDFGTLGYGAACPPRNGKNHHYVFRLYALDGDIHIKPGATRQQVMDAMRGHVLAEAEITALYRR
jgi:Raf kinase inhibitor-like YbhB/YbcL family protein